MSAEARTWLQYAEENRRIAAYCLSQGLYNPALQNSQQCVEKALKAAFVLQGLAIKKTHSIQTLIDELRLVGIGPILSDDECALLDAMYLPSKYPLGSVIPDYDPNESVTLQCVAMAEKTIREVNEMLARAEG